MHDEEIDRFKRYDLRLYAATLGFVLDKRESSRNSTVMRRGQNEKIIVTRKADGHYVFWSPLDDTQRGTIIDLAQKHKSLTLGGVRKELRGWTSTPGPDALQLPELATASKDLDAVRKRYGARG